MSGLALIVVCGSIVETRVWFFLAKVTEPPGNTGRLVRDSAR
jgi:hypothetical protein